MYAQSRGEWAVVALRVEGTSVVETHPTRPLAMNDARHRNLADIENRDVLLYLVLPDDHEALRRQEQTNGC